MRMRMHRTFGVLILSAVLLPGSLVAMCIPFPCDECWVENSGQLNWIEFDRANGTISMIPNILVRGSGEDLALVVPTPGFPAITPGSSAIWTEARLLSMPAQGTRSSTESLGCGQVEEVPVWAPAEDGVIVHDRLEVGAFDATIVSSDSPGALVEWLSGNGFDFDSSDESKIASLIEDEWFFTAMKLHDGVELPEFGWKVNVDPVVFTYEADTFEVPLEFLSINRSGSFPFVFYVVDDHRTTLPDYQTSYANRISENEYRAIASSYPTISSLLSAGRFVTKLERTYFGQDPMVDRLVLTQTDDVEFRASSGQQFGSFAHSLPIQIAMLTLPLLLIRRFTSFARSRRTNRPSPRT